MGAEFVTVDMATEVSADGCIKEMTAEQEQATAAMYDEEARAADIVITTALIRGRSGAAAAHRGDRRRDAPGQRHRRHGGRQRRQCFLVADQGRS